MLFAQFSATTTLVLVIRMEGRNDRVGEEKGERRRNLLAQLDSCVDVLNGFLRHIRAMPGSAPLSDVYKQPFLKLAQSQLVGLCYSYWYTAKWERTRTLEFGMCLEPTLVTTTTSREVRGLWHR